MKQSPPPSFNHGFSLLEVSILLTIIGLLVGGVLVGSTLIRAAALQSVATEQRKFVTAIHVFREKYGALPGDMTNATQFWGAAALPGNSDTCKDKKFTLSVPASPPTLTCDGNGNNQIDVNEDLRLWQHLSNAELIENYPYMGAADWDFTCYDANSTYARTCPLPKIAGGAKDHFWMVYYTDTAPTIGAATPRGFNVQYGNIILLKGFESLLTPIEAWNIDTKIDDGKPARGKVVIAGVVHVLLCADSTDMDNLDANYLVDSGATYANYKYCGFTFLNQF